MPGSILSQFLWLSLGYQRFSRRGSIWTSRMRKASILLALQSLYTNAGVSCLSYLAVSLIKGRFLVCIIVLRWGWWFWLYFWLNILEINPCKSFWTGINLRITAWIIFFFSKSIIFLYKGQNVLEYGWNNIFYLLHLYSETELCNEVLKKGDMVCYLFFQLSRWHD